MESAGLGVDPCKLLREELMEVLAQELAGKSQLVVMGDMNMSVGRPGAGVVRQEWDHWTRGMQDLSMVPVHREGWGRQGGMWTWEGQVSRGHGSTTCGYHNTCGRVVW